MAEYIEREAVKTCQDCIHKKVCYARLSASSIDYADVICDSFKSAADVVEIPQSGIGDLSDGYHTFNELYHHRAILFSLICNLMSDKAWKSKLHDTGDMYDGMFIVGIETPSGQATYHYDIDPYWEMFKAKELEKAPKWDGHTPQDAIERLSTLAADVVEVRNGEWIRTMVGDYCCSLCGRYEEDKEPYCNCGAKMN